MIRVLQQDGAIRDTRGLLRMVVDEKTYGILGVHLVAPQAADLVHIGVLAVRHGLTVGDLVPATFDPRRSVQDRGDFLQEGPDPAQLLRRLSCASSGRPSAGVHLELDQAIGPARIGTLA